MDPKPEDLAEFFRTRKIGFGRCLEPTMQCGEPAIRAHSIQNRQTIALRRIGRYDEPLLRQSFDGIEHDVIDLNDQAPCLAASSSITLKVPRTRAGRLRTIPA